MTQVKKAPAKKVVKKTPKVDKKAPVAVLPVPKRRGPRVYSRVANWGVRRRGNTLQFGCGSMTATIKEATEFFKVRPEAIKLDEQVRDIQIEIEKLISKRTGVQSLINTLQDKNRGYSKILLGVRRHSALADVDKNLAKYRKNLLQP